MSQQSQTAKPGGLGALFTSTIGLKVLMAVTGAALVLFVVQHMFANLQIFAGREVYNEYAHFMQSLGKLLWVARLGLILIVVLHIWAAVHVARLNDIRQRRFHGRAARAADGNGEGVVGLPGVAQQFLHFVHQLDEAGVKMADLTHTEGL